MVYFLYIVLAAIVVFLSIKLAKYVDWLDKSTNISGAFIGGVMLAAVTSLPELFTSISATLFLHQNELVLGNILGSNLFNFAVIGLSLVVFIKRVYSAGLKKVHLLSLGMMIAMYVFVALDVFLDVWPKIGWFSLSSPIILALYIAYLFLTPKKEEAEENASDEVTLSLKQIIIRFVICAVLLVAASIAITYVSDWMARELGLGMTFAGALLLGVATSLPETASTLSLCKRKNYNAAFGNILGSNVFNCTILVIADLLSFTSGATDVYTFNVSSQLLIILGGAVAALFAAMLGIFAIRRDGRIFKRISAGTVGVCAVAAYIIFTALSLVL